MTDNALPPRHDDDSALLHVHEETGVQLGRLTQVNRMPSGALWLSHPTLKVSGYIGRHGRGTFTYESGRTFNVDLNNAVRRLAGLRPLKVKTNQGTWLRLAGWLESRLVLRASR